MGTCSKVPWECGHSPLEKVREKMREVGVTRVLGLQDYALLSRHTFQRHCHHSHIVPFPLYLSLHFSFSLIPFWGLCGRNKHEIDALKWRDPGRCGTGRSKKKISFTLLGTAYTQFQASVSNGPIAKMACPHDFSDMPASIWHEAKLQFYLWHVPISLSLSSANASPIYSFSHSVIYSTNIY